MLNILIVNIFCNNLIILRQIQTVYIIILEESIIQNEALSIQLQAGN